MTTKTNTSMNNCKDGKSLFCMENVGRGSPRINIAMAGDFKPQLQRAFASFGCNIWLPEYDKLYEWLKGNEGKGLLMYGHCGRGKSVFGELILPVLIREYTLRTIGEAKYLHICSYRDLNDKLATLKNCMMLYIDDLGQEEFAKVYGNTIHAFADIVDEAEKKGHLLILSTNLSLDQLQDKYGDRVISRLKALTKTVLFEGNDLRK